VLTRRGSATSIASSSDHIGQTPRGYINYFQAAQLFRLHRHINYFWPAGLMASSSTVINGSIFYGYMNIDPMYSRVSSTAI
jgi:hypothetical protein